MQKRAFFAILFCALVSISSLRAFAITDGTNTGGNEDTPGTTTSPSHGGSTGDEDPTDAGDTTEPSDKE